MKRDSMEDAYGETDNKPERKRLVAQFEHAVKRNPDGE